MSPWNLILAMMSSSLFTRDWMFASRMLGRGARCVRALSLFLTPAHFPRGRQYWSRPLFLLRISLSQDGSGTKTNDW